MAKFKVGDEVKLGGGCARVIHIESTGDFPYLVERADNRIEFCNDAEMMLIAPAIPDGWTPVSEPPDNYRDMHVMLNDGEKRFGWYNAEPIQADVDSEWYLYPKGTTQKDIVDGDVEFIDQPADPGKVLAWREIEPAAAEPKPDAQVRYAVTREGKPDGYDFDKENCYRTYDDAVTSAKKNFYDGDKQHVEVWKLVAIVNPPAEPEVVKLEE